VTFRRRSLGAHPDDVPGHLTRAEVWQRIFLGVLVGVSLAVAAARSDAEVIAD
jgi:hypothetical protein